MANDVDLYNVQNVPDGAGHVLGFLPAGSTVTLVGNCNKEDWCQVSGATLDQRNGTTQNNAQGWVWGNLNF